MSSAPKDMPSPVRSIRHTQQGKLWRHGAGILCVGLCAALCLAVYQNAGDATPSILLGKALPSAPLKATASKLAEGDAAPAEGDAAAAAPAGVGGEKYVTDTSDGAGMVRPFPQIP